MIRRGLLLLAAPVVVAALVVGASAAQAQPSEVEPGTALLCPNPLEIKGGICPAQEAGLHVGVRIHLLGVTEHTVTVGAIEKWAEFPATPSVIGDTYWAGWHTTTQSWMQGLVNATGYTAGTGMGGPIPAGTNVTVWMFPVVQEVEWVWGEPCQTPNGYTGPCGHYKAVYDPEGGSVTTTTLSAPKAARLRKR